MESRQSSWSVLLLLAALLLPAGASATDYREDYDYPNQGDDWYGRLEGADPRRDYEGLAPLVDTFSDGDDFALGYDAAFAYAGRPVALLRTQRQQSLYKYLHETTFGCLAAADCSDGIVCNGAEQCSDNACGAGSPPVCDDQDPCTDDACSESFGGCRYTLVPPPPEVPQLLLSLDAPGSSVARIEWTAPAGSIESYNVYRGESSTLGDLTCLQGGVADTELLDDGTLPASGLYVHLVSAFACTQESTLGFDSDGAERANPGPCP